MIIITSAILLIILIYIGLSSDLQFLQKVGIIVVTINVTIITIDVLLFTTLKIIFALLLAYSYEVILYILIMACLYFIFCI